MDRFTVELADRTIALDALDQRSTYGGMVEGLPTVETNRRRVGSWIDEASSRWGIPVHSIPAAEEPIEWTEERPYPFGTPSALPGVQIRARFRSTAIGGLDALRFSALTVVWFQPTWAMPVAPSVLSEIQAIDWDPIAADLEV